MTTPTATPAPLSVDEHLLAAVAEGRHHDPHAVLGAHPHPDGAAVTYRALRPFAGVRAPLALRRRVRRRPLRW